MQIGGMTDINSNINFKRCTYKDHNLIKDKASIRLINIVSFMVNFFARDKDFSVNYVLIVPTSYFLYSFTKGSMISNQTFGNIEIIIIVV